jgi:Skp family chaperone for outer membrane proteins
LNRELGVFVGNILKDFAISKQVDYLRAWMLSKSKTAYTQAKDNVRDCAANPNLDSDVFGCGWEPRPIWRTCYIGAGGKKNSTILLTDPSVFSVGVSREFCFPLGMKFLRKTVLALLLTVPLCGLAAPAQTKIGTVDLRKLFDGYWKTKQAQASLNARKAELDADDKTMREGLKKGSDEYQKLLEQANDQAISSEERDRRKQAAADKLKQLQESKNALDTFERQAQVTLSEQGQRMRENLLADIKAAIATQARAAGYSLVIDAAAETANATTAVVYTSGENDLTAAVLKQLNAGAPISTAVPAVTTPSALFSNTNSPSVNLR